MESDPRPNGITVKVLITGARGLIGSALVGVLEAGGTKVVRLVRTRGETGVRWDPERAVIDADAMEGFDALIHLAGASVGRWWTRSYKERIRSSRVDGAALLVRALAKLRRRPTVFVSASAVGYYGDRGDDVLNESSSPGEGFRAQVCREWESVTAPARTSGVRVVWLRSGNVLTAAGGLLPRLMLPTRWGPVLQLGSGRQYMSYISIDDEVRAILHVLEQGGLEGPYNLTAPDPVRQSDFSDVLTRVADRPFKIRVPAGALELAVGRERAREVLLSSQRAVPHRLLASGFSFLHPTVEAALRAALGVEHSRAEL